MNVHHICDLHSDTPAPVGLLIPVAEPDSSDADILEAFFVFAKVCKNLQIRFGSKKSELFPAAAYASRDLSGGAGASLPYLFTTSCSNRNRKQKIDMSDGIFDRLVQLDGKLRDAPTVTESKQKLQPGNCADIQSFVL